ncbi:hypothetical protein B0F90DRAFT_1735510 [Multifurca ochricompacta]|uniref:Uncharacterized protein n=1 Tax=Multifurca ochricompacta TaxID=376703 RepID=A0AAD4M1A0_9AGAM|nr:hypothetical protein B0F90DRAFT_1735475 [Multifurca ochricompacta]KAI0298168.1 hypothetical protein B0F90DRAFT_1735510 [Multifurca ochricompacta]
MKFFIAFFLGTLAATVSSLPLAANPNVNENLIPQFGTTAGVNATGPAGLAGAKTCDGPTKGPDGKPVPVPCTCPPDRATFIASLNANVKAGHILNNPGVSAPFPTDDSKASQLARLQTAMATLQNLNGTGQGCPVASTTFPAQQKALQG